MTEFRYNLNDVHRFLLQYIISKSYVEKSELESKFNTWLSEARNQSHLHNQNDEQNTQQDNQRNIHQLGEDSEYSQQEQEMNIPELLDKYIEDINDNLRTVSMIISYHIFKPDRKWYYSISNLLGDDNISKLATHFSPLEIQFFKSILAQIVDLDINGQKLHFMDALALRPKELKTEMADICLERLIREGWLWEDRENNRRSSNSTRILWFGIRTCHDLRAYLDQEFQYSLP